MKLLKKLLLAIIATLAVLMVMPKIVPQIQNVGAVQASSIKISSKKKTMYKGYTYNLKVTGTNKKVKWSSSDKSKATVNSKGKVYAKKNGKVTITAKVAGKKYKCKVTVKNKPYNFTQFNTTFYDLKDVAKEYRDVEKVKNYKDFVFDLDGDGRKDTVRLKNTGVNENSAKTYELQLNGKKFFEGETTYAETVYVADLNRNDNTLELIVRTMGPGDCASFIIFSKKGNKLKEISNDVLLGTAYVASYEMKIDGKGKMILEDYLYENISPKIFPEYYKFKNNKITTKKLDLKKLKNMKFKNTQDMLFTYNMKVIKNFYEKYYKDGDEGIKNALNRAGIIEGKFKSFNIIGEDKTGAIKVRLKNGTKGYLFTVAGYLAG